MSGDLSVNPEALRTSAQAAQALAGDLSGATSQPITTSSSAADSLQGWSLSQAVREVADTWRPALKGLHDRVATEATQLTSTATSHDWNEKLIEQDFEKAASRPGGETPFG